MPHPSTEKERGVCVDVVSIIMMPKSLHFHHSKLSVCRHGAGDRIMYSRGQAKQSKPPCLCRMSAFGRINGGKFNRRA